MPKIKKSDLNYDDYSWTAVPGDNPDKKRADSDRFNRNEGYEVLYFLNSLTGPDNSDLPKKTRLICEWMIRERLPSNIQSRSKVTQWISANYKELKDEYPFET